MSVKTVTAIIKAVCEAEPADPDHPDTVCINVLTLEQIVAQHLDVLICSDDPLPSNTAASSKEPTR